MSATPQPVSFAGALSLQADQSLPADPIPYNFTGQYTQLQDSLLNLSGSGTENVPFGSIAGAGAIGLLISYPPGQVGSSAVLVTINGGSEPLEISPGGMIAWFNPTPGAGVTTCSIEYLTSCQLRVRVLG